MKQSEFYKLISYLGCMIFITGCILMTYTAQNRETLQHNLVQQLLEEISKDPSIMLSMTKSKQNGIEDPLGPVIKSQSQGLRSLFNKNTYFNEIITLSGFLALIGVCMLAHSLTILNRLARSSTENNTA